MKAQLRTQHRSFQVAAGNRQSNNEFTGGEPRMQRALASASGSDLGVAVFNLADIRQTPSWKQESAMLPLLGSRDRFLPVRVPASMKA